MSILIVAVCEVFVRGIKQAVSAYLSEQGDIIITEKTQPKFYLP